MKKFITENKDHPVKLKNALSPTHSTIVKAPGALRLGVAATLMGIAILTSACGSNSGTSSVSALLTTSTLTSGCAPLTGIIGFTATTAYVDAANIYAVPNSTGTVTVGVASALGGTWTNTWNSAVSDAYIFMTPASTVATTSSYLYGSAGTYPYTVGTFSPYSSSYYSASNYMTLSGTLELTQTRLATIAAEVGTTAISSLCVESVAISVGHYNTELYGGWVYLYLNNGDYVPLEL